MELLATSRVYIDLKSNKTGSYYYLLRTIKLIILSQRATETHWRLGKYAWKKITVSALGLYTALHVHDGSLLQRGYRSSEMLVQSSIAFLRLSLTNVSVKTAAKMQACFNLHVASEMES